MNGKQAVPKVGQSGSHSLPRKIKMVLFVDVSSGKKRFPKILCWWKRTFFVTSGGKEEPFNHAP